MYFFIRGKKNIEDHLYQITPLNLYERPHNQYDINHNNKKKMEKSMETNEILDYWFIKYQ